MSKVMRLVPSPGTDGEEGYKKYATYHANPFEGVNEMIKACNLQNYSIYYYDGLLFSYYEYVGDDYEADMGQDGGRTPRARSGGPRSFPA